MEYALGFFYDMAGESIVLIKKTKPAWQAGRFNAVGGKIEKGEIPIQAMRREFQEEAGLDIKEWEHTATLEGLDWKVYVFRAFGEPLETKTQTEESITVFPTNNLPSNMISNLRWLVPLNLDRKGGVKFPVKINYNK